MGNSLSNSKRVLKNTVSLYIRMAILTFISLFTVRIVLKTLGAEDYGLYNVVGGFVSMFSFLSGTLTIASQRYFSICLAKNDWKQLNKTFSVNLTIYVVFSVIILVLAETIGLWFVMNKLSIAAGRETAAVLVYQFSIITFLITLLISPYLALLVADENLSIYSIVSILEGILKVAVVYLLYISPGDKLITYAVLLCALSLIINGFYLMYCIKKYRDLRIKVYKDRTAFKEVFSYMNWNLIGAIASVCKSQGVNVIMNIFFGSAINAARGIAFQINNIIVSFAQNFMKAVNPQITKNDALQESDKLNNLLVTSSKFSFFLCFIISLPLMMNMRYVLKLWLGNVPDYTVEFAILALIDALIATLTEPITTAVQATGKVKIYQLTVGVTALLNLPLSYLLLKISNNPLLPFFVSIGITLGMGIGRLVNYRFLQDFSIFKYLKNVMAPVLLITLITFVFNFFVCTQAQTLINLIIKCVISILFSAFVIFVVGMNKPEKKLVLSFFSKGRINE